MAAVICTLLALCAPASASTLSAANGHLAAFPVYGAYGGTLGTTAGGDFGDHWAFSARVTGGSGYDFARGRFNVSWLPGATVTYSGSFLLPAGYHTARSGQLTLMRWDNYGAAANWEQDALNVNLATGTASLMHETVTGGHIAFRRLAGPFRVPVNRWFTARVTQTLANSSAARNAVYLNSHRVGASRTPNLRGAAATAVRYGIVATFAGAQHGHTALRFDRATASYRPPRTVSTTPTPVSSSSSAYVSPFTTTYTVGRTDMGVDFCLPAGAPIRAIGNGVVLGVMSNWYTDPATGKAQPYVWYQLSSGPDAGRVVYLAEQIKLLVSTGDHLTAGQKVATYASTGTCLETGWGDPNGTGRTDAQVTTGYKEGQVTDAGVSFARFLRSLGVAGSYELTPTS